MIQETRCITVVEEGFICANFSHKTTIKLTSQGSRKGWSTFRRVAQYIAIIFSYNKCQDNKTWDVQLNKFLKI